MMKRASKEETSKYIPWFVAGAVVLLLIASLSFFITNNIYNSERFASKVTSAITSEASREALAQEIVSEMLADQSLLVKGVLSDPLEAIVAGLIDTEIFSTALFETTSSLHNFFVTKDIEPITIDIGSITSIVDVAVDGIKPDNQLDLSKFDEEIILFEETNLPPFKSIGQTILFLGPLSILLIIGMGVFAYKKLTDKTQLLKYSGYVLMITGSIMLVLTYTSGSLLTLSILDPEKSTIMSEIYNSFVASLRFQQFIMILIGGLLLGGYYYRKNNVSLSITPKKR